MPLVIWIPIVIWCLVLMFKIRSSVPEGQSSDQPLSTEEKIQIWIICLLIPILGGAIFYYGWKNRLPIKAKTANRISWTVFGLSAILLIIMSNLGLV